VEGANTNNYKTQVFHGKPVEDGTKESEEGAIGGEAKELSNKLLVEGPEAQRSVILHFPSQPCWMVAVLICGMPRYLQFCWPNKKDKSYVCPS
jgi:hypothetical protein